MKKILFAVINMNIGGVEKALLNMLEEMPQDKYDVTVLMLEEYGGFLDYIPDWVNVKVLDCYEEIKRFVNDPPQYVAIDLFKNKQYIKSFKILFYYILSKVINNMNYYYSYVLKEYSCMDEEFDIAIAYHGPMDFISYIVGKKIKAKKRIQWIHFDITSIPLNYKVTGNVFKYFDKIFVVSDKGKEKFIEIYPELKNKTSVFLNIISSNLIKKNAKEGIGFSDKFDGIRILTVGRLCMEKGQDLIIPVLARLRSEGYNVRWYCVGDGSEETKTKYKDLIKLYKVEDSFILLGADTNPYTYMNQCDIYVQPSRYEGYCITLAEARCLNKPIISTDFTGAREQINHGETGFIVKINEDELYKSVKELIENEELRSKFSINLRDLKINAMSKINKLDCI